MADMKVVMSFEHAVMRGLLSGRTPYGRWRLLDVAGSQECLALSDFLLVTVGKVQIELRDRRLQVTVVWESVWNEQRTH